MTQKPDLSFWKLWNLSFGFFGVQIAYALQSANISRIFATLGADPHNLSYFWILPPLMGILVQPIVGTLSDKTWCRFGRRIPYLFVGATVAVLVPAAEFRFSWSDGKRSDALRLDCPDVPRYEHQYGDAAFQDAGRRYGKREAEGKGLLYPEFPLQCRFCSRIYLSIPLYLPGYQECSRRGRGA